MRLFLFLALFSSFAVAQPLRYEICDYYRGQFLCRDFDPRTDGRRAEAFLARYNPPPASVASALPVAKTVVEVVSETPSAPLASALSPDPVTIPPVAPSPAPVAPVSSPKADPKGMGPYIPVPR